MLGIIGAMESEIRLLLGKMQEVQQSCLQWAISTVVLLVEL